MVVRPLLPDVCKWIPACIPMRFVLDKVGRGISDTFIFEERRYEIVRHIHSSYNAFNFV